jgi:hypothetical protein
MSWYQKQQLEGSFQSTSGQENWSPLHFYRITSTNIDLDGTKGIGEEP